jgi:hypothetical protein
MRFFFVAFSRSFPGPWKKFSKFQEFSRNSRNSVNPVICTGTRPFAKNCHMTHLYLKNQACVPTTFPITI